MAHDPKASSQVMANWLLEHPPVGPVLLVDDAGPIGPTLDDLGLAHQSWLRYAWDGARATPWPPDGPFQTAVIRLPKGRAAQRMVLHAVAARLGPGGRCLVHGHNDEGIKSAKKPALEVFERAEAVDARRHCRLWACEGRLDAGRSELEDWATEVSATVRGKSISWTSWPGLFAHGRLDAGTELLLASLPRFAAGTKLLDFACGAGVIAQVLQARNPGVELDLLDLDALALHAARRNVPSHHKAWLSDAWQGVAPGARWDVIVSNPPWHAGVATDWAALHELVRRAPSHLNPRGSLWIVTQRNVRVEDGLRQGFGKLRVAGSTPGFRVWQASL